MKLKIAVLTLLLPLCSLASCGNSQNANGNGNYQVAQVDRDKAQEVIDLIDAIGIVTLESESAIKNAETAYNALTAQQKTLVTNYNKLTQARADYEKLKLDEETKNDPTRTIKLSDLNGSWISTWYEWKIGDVGGGKSVLYWVYNAKTGIPPTGQIITNVGGSSSLVGYNPQTRRMEVKLFHYNMMGGEYLNVTMTKSEEGLKIYWKNEIFERE